MATAKRDLTDPTVQGHTVHPLDKMIAIAARIAEREGLLLDDGNLVSKKAVRTGKERADVTQDRRTA